MGNESSMTLTRTLACITCMLFYIVLITFTAKSAHAAVKVEPCSSKRCVDYFNHFKTAAKRGHADSIATLAEFYYHGFGTKKSLSQARKHYRKAAKLGVVRAQYKLGLLYLNVDEFKDLEQGIKYLKRAAYNQHIKAAYLLGAIYYSEQFGEQDKLEADKWLADAYRGRHKDMPAFIAHILSYEALTKHQFPHLYSAIKQMPLVTNKDNVLAWPSSDAKKDMEVITVSSPDIDTLLKEQMVAARKQAKQLGSRMPGVDCRTAIACKALTLQEGGDQLEILSTPASNNGGNGNN